MIFSERYSDLIQINYGIEQDSDTICGNIDYYSKKNIADVMIEFNEKKIEQSSIVDNYEPYEIHVLNKAIKLFNKKKERIRRSIKSISCLNNEEDAKKLASVFTPFLFDVIELQYNELSNAYKHRFQTSINNVLREENIPWLLCDGCMIKIDSKQFEYDLKRKALEKMQILKDAEPVFQSAYNEFISATECLGKSEYSEAINYAEKSYESILKVTFHSNYKTADKLTKDAIQYLKLPNCLDTEKFRNKVLMSLPCIRNECSAHGAGMADNNISSSLANLAVNLAASLDTYLIDEYRQEI